jgi:predicted alpha-1,2-mannosidase
LLALARNWRNLFDPDTRFVRPRRANGMWLDPYHPETPDGFREGNGWQYTWLVPHDVAGLLAGMGRDTAVQRLDQFFAAALAPVVGPEAQQKLSLYGITYYGNQYAPSNEHDLQAPWLYDWTGEPWKGQALQRSLQSLFRATPDGLPGNDDLGTMSAWFIWSALGFYPVTPGAPIYVIGSPLFERAVIHAERGDVVVSAPGASAAAPYVQSVRLNGAALADTWFTHGDLLGGTIELAMGPVPSAWGSAPADAPPSMSTAPLTAFACAP